MATLYYAAFSGQQTMQIPRNPLGSDVKTVTASTTQSNALPAGTLYVRVVSDVACIYVLGENPTVTTSNGFYLPAGFVDYAWLPDGVSAANCKIAVKSL